MELASAGETETPMQKYHRLNCEVKELQEEIEKVLTSDKSQKDDQEKQELAGVAGKVRLLHDELDKIKLEEVLGSQLIKVCVIGY